MASPPSFGTPLTMDRVGGSGAMPTVGVQFHGMWASYTDGQRAEVLDALRDAGIRTVRLDVSWAMLQPAAADRFDPWGVDFVDRVVGMCVQRRLAPLITLWLTPGWANGHRGERALPIDPDDYARVARWLARRYAGRVLGYEVWNEPNSTDFLADADAAAYTDVLAAAYPAFHRGDPGTVVVFGGVQYNDDAWIQRAYSAGAQGSFDIMATHPYPAVADQPPDLPEDETSWVLSHAAAVHNLMAGYGDGAKPIWFTELGWSTHANPVGTPNHALGVTEATQARYLNLTLDLIRTTMPYVRRLYWYAERDTLAHDDVHNQNFGLLRRDHSAKPILAAVRAHTRMNLSGPPSSGTGRRSPA